MVKLLPREAEMLRKARIEMGYTQQEAASLIGVHIKACQRLEYGERDIRNASMRIGLAIPLHSIAKGGTWYPARMRTPMRRFCTQKKGCPSRFGGAAPAFGIARLEGFSRIRCRAKHPGRHIRWAGGAGNRTAPRR